MFCNIYYVTLESEQCLFDLRVEQSEVVYCAAREKPE